MGTVSRKVKIVAGAKFQRRSLPIGGDSIPVLVSHEDGQPRAVFMSYESFLEVAATLYTAVEALRLAGVDPDLLFGSEPEDDSVPQLKLISEPDAASGS